MLSALTAAYRTSETLGLYLRNMRFAQQHPSEQLPGLFSQVLVLDIGEQAQGGECLFGKADLHCLQLETHSGGSFPEERFKQPATELQVLAAIRLEAAWR